jgi:hypothetical protein
MKLLRLHILLFLLACLWVSTGNAQISPGRLSRAHSDLEGMANCTKCHTIGEKISNTKCLDCHKEIQTRIDKKKGYHASKEVAGKDCFTCHSEHHGLNFEMIRFDEENFDHQLTGYALTGAHKKIDCRDCHKPDFVEDPKLKKLPDTYLGLGQACISCHEDYHQNTLSPKCTDCHTTEAFTPASRFNHDKTNYPLVGKHVQVDCVSCHKTELRNGKEFQVFAGVSFANCNSCHEDPHQNQLGVDCKQCHNEQSFSSLATIRKFNHSKTQFPLKGAHQQVNCAECHNMDAPPISIFQDRLGVKTTDCNTCHDDIHEGRFGLQCVDCHNEKSFTQVNTENFNHNLTDFALLGKHQSVDCKACHTSDSFTDPMPHQTCAACHEDYHEGEFVVNQVSPDCAECHVVDGFLPSTYTLEQHAQGKFPLTGAHIATPCFACHLQENQKWSFRNIGSRCVDCHEDVHAGTLAAQFYPDSDCQACHTTETWKGLLGFDHNRTTFPLQGVHSRTTCVSCHIRDEAHPYGKFIGVTKACYTCHDDVHGKQFEENSITDCNRCHGFDDWKAPFFDHAATRFPLEGKHAQVDCAGCHKPVDMEGASVILYKIEKFECKDCHR